MRSKGCELPHFDSDKSVLFAVAGSAKSGLFEILPSRGLDVSVGDAGEVGGSYQSKWQMSRRFQELTLLQVHRRYVAPSPQTEGRGRIDASRSPASSF